VAVLADSFYALDRGSPRIFRLDAAGRVQATVNLAPYSTYGLNGLAVDARGNVYVADTGRNRLLVFSPGGQLIKQVGHSGSDIGGFTQPMMLALAADDSFFVADWENGRIERWDPSFQATDAWSTGFRPFGVAIDQLGRVFVPDAEHRRVQAYSGRGASLGEIGAPGSGPGVQLSPKQVAVVASPQPLLYVLGSDGIERIDLQNTAPPPAAGADVDLVSLAVIFGMVALLVLAVLSRRQRRRATSVGATPGRPVRLDAKDGAQRQHQEPRRDEDLLIAHQAKGKQ
jgi:DNA-binding beta-propeller fold protein YncE